MRVQGHDIRQRHDTVALARRSMLPSHTSNLVLCSLCPPVCSSWVSEFVELAATDHRACEVCRVAVVGPRERGSQGRAGAHCGVRVLGCTALGAAVPGLGCACLPCICPSATPPPHRAPQERWGGRAHHAGHGPRCPRLRVIASAECCAAGILAGGSCLLAPRLPLWARRAARRRAGDRGPGGETVGLSGGTRRRQAQKCTCAWEVPVPVGSAVGAAGTTACIAGRVR